MAIVGLLFVCSYLIREQVASTLIIQAASDRNNTNPHMVKVVAWYLSSPNFPSSLFVFSLASISFHLKPQLVILYELILS
jgi:hypothetical protein